MYTGLNYQYSNSLSFITTNHYGSGNAAEYQVWKRNGVTLVQGVDYNVNFDQYGVNQIQTITRFNTGDIFILELYSDLAHTALLETGTCTILPIFSYLETYSPHANGIIDTTVTDESAVQLANLTIEKCKTTPINAHIKNNFIIINNAIANPITLGNFKLDGVNIDDPDIETESLQSGTYSFSSGILTHDSINMALQFFKPTDAHKISYTHNDINSGNDLSFAINNIGFSKIGSDGMHDRYCFFGDDVNVNPRFATATSTYEIEITSLYYFLRVDGVVVKVVTRGVVYSTSRGVVDNAASLPYGTTVNHHSTQNGTGYIQALIDGSIIARQNINVSQIQAPEFNFINGQNTCPAIMYNLGLLVLANPQLGYTLKWFSDLALGNINLMSDLVITESGTFYAAFESNSDPGCYSAITQFTVTINECADAIDNSFSTATNTPISINFGSNDVKCNVEEDTSWELVADVTNGVLSGFNPTNGTVLYTPNLGYIGNDSFTYKIKCAGEDQSEATVNISVTGNCNQEIIIKVLRNNCPSGIPTAISYTIPANTFCGNYTSVGAANWAAYIGSLAAAQTQANTQGQCISCSGSNPCVLEYEVGRIVVRGVPGGIVKVYKGELVLFEMPIPISGDLEINHEFLIGEIFVTLTGMDNIESQKGCLPIVLKSRDEKCKPDCGCN